MPTPSLRPPPRRRWRLRPEEIGGVGMTLCLAVLCRKANTFVTVSDLMLSTEWTSADTAVTKMKPFGPGNRWLCLYAGSPSVWQKAIFERLPERCPGSSENTVENVAAAVKDVFNDTLREEIEDRVLRPLGLSRDTFLRHGREWFGAKHFRSLVDEVRAVKLDTQFLVAGWDQYQLPRLFSVCDDEPVSAAVQYHDGLGFHAIGSGWVQGLGSLYAGYRTQLTLAETVYRACEAKFCGESAPGVGKATVVWMLDGDGKHSIITQESVTQLRAVWEQERQKMPSDALAVATSVLSKTRVPLPFRTADKE